MDGGRANCAFAFDKGFFEGLSGGLLWIEYWPYLVTDFGERTDRRFARISGFAGRGLFVIIIGLDFMIGTRVVSIVGPLKKRMNVPSSTSFISANPCWASFIWPLIIRSNGFECCEMRLAWM